MEPTAQALRQAMVDAFDPFLSRIAEEHQIAEAVTEAKSWLTTELDNLLSLPFHQQRRGPLEVFQEALQFPTEALLGLGVPPPSRQPAEAAALPGDVYGLAPASSQDLGQAVWEAHIAWGAHKAATLTTVCWFGRDLGDRSRIEAAADEVNRSFVVSPGDLAGCGLAVIDLTAAGATEALREATAADLPVVAYGPHVDTASLGAAAEQGAVAVPRSKFFADVSSFLTQ